MAYFSTVVGCCSPCRQMFKRHHWQLVALLHYHSWYATSTTISPICFSKWRVHYVCNRIDEFNSLPESLPKFVDITCETKIRIIHH